MDFFSLLEAGGGSGHTVKCTNQMPKIAREFWIIVLWNYDRQNTPVCVALLAVAAPLRFVRCQKSALKLIEV